MWVIGIKIGKAMSGNLLYLLVSVVILIYLLLVYETQLKHPAYFLRVVTIENHLSAAKVQ